MLFILIKRMKNGVKLLLNCRLNSEILDCYISVEFTYCEEEKSFERYEQRKNQMSPMGTGSSSEIHQMISQKS